MRTSTLLRTLVLLAFAGCCKDKEADLPQEVTLGKSVVYLNGCKNNYEAHFQMVSLYNHINFAFLDTQKDIINQVSFSWLPVAEGEFDVHSEPIQNWRALTYFSQIVDEDVVGYTYKLENPEEGFFNIEGLDTVKQEVKGRFRAQFRRTSKNGYKDLGLPETLLFQGVFNEKYLVK
jgi:hypothetical protein